ncbi:MAG TPA: HAD hydrolase family protein [Anaeromyxobacteraceae bacterium]|jgi:3-deoxy-D-manno-octulosonate 8-phosphate phosphatase (KDO 8-P phosphatase)
MRPRGRSRSRLDPRALLARAARLRLLLFDVDGVLTDGRLWYGPEGEAMKSFDVQDGHGIVLLRDHLQLGVISGRPGKVSEVRLRELRFQHLVFAERDKLAGYARLALGIPDEEVGYMGDDLNDLPLLRRVGLSAAPADARPEVREAVHFVANAQGGRGAVRELCELVLRAKGIRVG